MKVVTFLLLLFNRFLEHMPLILSSSVTTITAQAKLFSTHLAPISRYLARRISDVPVSQYQGGG